MSFYKSIRSQALQWFLSKYKNDEGKIYTSKYYQPKESWPGVSVWWLKISMTAVNDSNYKYVHFFPL